MRVLSTGHGRIRDYNWFAYMCEKISTYIAGETYILFSVCVCCKVVKTACARAREEGMRQYCKHRRTAHTTKQKTQSYVYKQARTKKTAAKIVAHEYRRAAARILFAAGKTCIQEQHNGRAAHFWYVQRYPHEKACKEQMEQWAGWNVRKLYTYNALWE